MAIDNPDLFDRPIASRTGTLASAQQVTLDDDTTVEANLNNVLAVQAVASRAGIAWNFDTGTTEDPPGNSFRFNNADPRLATTLYVDKFSIAGRFDEFLLQFAIGGYIYLQDRTNPVNNFLFRTTSLPVSTGGNDGWFVINVEFLRAQSTLTAVNGDTFTFIFIPVSSTDGGGALPNMFLNEISESDTPVYTRKIDTEATVRFWLRSDTVDPGEESTAGIGIRIDEANGDLPEGGDTYQDDQNHTNVYIYLSVDDAFDTATDLNTVWVVITRDQGQPDESIPYVVNLGMNFTERADLAASGVVYESTTGFDGNGPFIHYRNGDVIELYFQDTERFFTISEANAPNVDLTRAVKTLTEEQTDSDFQAKLNYQHGIPSDDQFKLDQLVEVSSTSASAVITGTDQILYKSGSFSGDSGDYFTTDFDTGLPPNLGDTPQTWLVAVPHQYQINGAQGIESGAANATEVRQNLRITGATGVFNIYTIPLPGTASGTNFFQLVGTTTTITEIDPSSLIKIGRINVQPEFLALIENNQSVNNFGERLTAAENKISVLYPLAPDVNVLTDWGNIYIPQRALQEVVETAGYDLAADYRGPSTRFESAGVTYDDTGTNVVRYTGLSQSLQRLFGFKVSGPADQVLMWLVDGSELIPFIDVTAAGNYRVNNYTPTHTAAQPVPQFSTELTAVGDDNIISTAANDNAIFLIPDYPAGATNTSRTVSAGFEVLVNGVDSQGEHFVNIDVPETNVAQDRVRVTFTADLGPLHNSRQVTVTIDYRFTVPSPSEYRMVFTMISGPSDITLRVQDVFLTRSYTAATSVARADNFQTLGDAAGTYTFTGENELIIGVLPYPASNTMSIVPVAVDSNGAFDQLNDQSTPVPHTGFATVEIPDTTAFPSFEFRTARLDHFLTHNDLQHLLGDRALQWVYGLERLRTIATTHAVNEPIDLASGSTVGGQVITAGRTDQVAQTFTPAASVTVSLPVGTTLGQFILLEVTWHTGVGTATDNNNRNYTEMGFVPAIVNATDAELILGGRGRGAENFGIEVTTTGVDGTTTALTLDIINLNDAGGAALPAGSLITQVRFY